jgi:hypothetical protein
MPTEYDSPLARKLNLKSGMRVRVLAKPADVDITGLSTTDAVDADGIIVFVRTLADVDAGSEPVLDAARLDRIVWLVYPKAGQLGTDLNRDILWRHMLEKGVQGVRQIAIDDIWSALRFRVQR